MTNWKDSSIRPVVLPEPLKINTNDPEWRTARLQSVTSASLSIQSATPVSTYRKLQGSLSNKHPHQSQKNVAFFDTKHMNLVEEKVDLEDTVNGSSAFELKKSEVGKRSGFRDQGTQVFTRGELSRYAELSSHALRSQTAHGACEVDGCFNLADGGTCDYRVCFSKGCSRTVCASHLTDESNNRLRSQLKDDDAFNGRNVCLQCEERAARAFKLAVFVAFILPFVLGLPCLLLYSHQ